MGSWSGIDIFSKNIQCNERECICNLSRLGQSLGKIPIAIPSILQHLPQVTRWGRPLIGPSNSQQCQCIFIGADDHASISLIGIPVPLNLYGALQLNNTSCMHSSPVVAGTRHYSVILRSHKHFDYFTHFNMRVLYRSIVTVNMINS